MTIEEESMRGKVDRGGSRVLMVAFALLLLAAPSPVRAEEDVWPALKQMTFGDRAIKAEDGKIVLDAPTTAEDASLVPITMRVPPEVRDNLKSLTLIIDKNPNPVVAKFSFGPAEGAGGERSISTRVRIDSFSHVRAILEERQRPRQRECRSRQDAGEDLPSGALHRASVRGPGDVEAPELERHATRH
jgi:predicted secreted protein